MDYTSIQPLQSTEAQFRHFAFDNADFNVRTLTGHGTFHSLGGLRYRSVPSAKVTAIPAFPRQLDSKGNDVLLKGVMNVNWYKVPSKVGVKGIEFTPLIPANNDLVRYGSTNCF